MINIVTGMPAEIGKELMANETVRKISFTGSTRVGALLMKGAADSIKRLSLELGGNAPFIVFDDADLDLAVEGAVASKFRNGGQTCVCANRILVQAGIYDAFAAKLADRVAEMKVGAGTEEGVVIGPMINGAAIEKIERHVADALEKGARIIAQSEAVPEGKQYARPILLGDATTEMLLASEETFGPVAPLFRFETEEEAIAIANGTPFGLAAYFYTENLKRSWRVAEALEFGMVGLNTGLISTEVAPFGGVKQSGLGREGSQLGDRGVSRGQDASCRRVELEAYARKRQQQGLTIEKGAAQTAPCSIRYFRLAPAWRGRNAGLKRSSGRAPGRRRRPARRYP